LIKFGAKLIINLFSLAQQGKNNSSRGKKRRRYQKKSYPLLFITLLAK
jgi:hypothetical protein